MADSPQWSDLSQSWDQSLGTWDDATNLYFPDFGEMLEEAFERCGLPGPQTGNDFRTGRRSLNLLGLEWANRGLNLWAIDSQTISLQAGVATYDLPANTIDITDASLRQGSALTQSDITINRMTYSAYSMIPTKNTQGLPIQYFVSRLPTPTVTLWQVPDKDDTYTLYYWRLRALPKMNSLPDEASIPSRFIPAMIAGLAYNIALKKPEAMNRIDLLKAAYEEQFEMAASEDRDRSSLHIVPAAGYY